MWMTLGFIALVGAAGVAIGTRSTVADGRVIAADLYESISKSNKRLAKVDCQPEIPIGRYGAVFECTLYGDDGSTARVEYHMTRDGALSPKLLDSTGATRRRSSASGDPWDE